MSVTLEDRPRAHVEDAPTEATVLPGGAWRAIVILGGIALLTVPCGLLRLFETFQFYDDEGYFLISLSSHSAGHALYDEVFTQYGPLYHQALGLVFGILGVGFTHEAARITTLVLWTATSVLCGITAFRLSRSVLAAAVAQLLAFALLAVLADEPLHPGGLTCLIIAGASALAAGERSSSSLRLLTLGVLAGALLSIKVNVGILAVLALAAALLAAGPWTGSWRGVGLLPCAALPLVPFVLLRDLLGENAVACHAAVVSLSLVPLCADSLRRRSPTPLAPRAIACGMVGVAVVPVLSLGAALARGTTPRGLLEGLVLGPLRLPRVFSIPMDVPDFWFLGTGASLVLWAHALVRERRDGVPPSHLAPLRVGLSFLALASLAGLVPLKAMFFVLPFLWLLCPADGSFTPRFLGLLAGLQALHAYPVAGSQVAFATFLLAPLAAAGARAGLGEALARSVPPSRAVHVRRGMGVAALGIVGLSGLYTGTPSAWASYRDGLVDLDLPGAGGLRLPEWQVAAYQWVAANLRAHADTFVSLPGLNSFHLWSGVAPPTFANATVWPILLDAPTQDRIAATLESHEDACAVVQRFTAPLWAPRIDLASMPLARAIREDFHLAGSALGYDFLVRRDRQVDLVHCALIVEAEGGSAELEVRLSPLLGGRPERAVVVDASTGAELVAATRASAREGRIAAVRFRLPPAQAVEGPEGLRPPCLVRLLDAEGRRVGSLPLIRREAPP